MPIESNRIYRFLSEKPSLKIFTSAGEVVEFSPYYTTQDEIIASELRKLKNIYEVDVLEGATLLPLPGKMVLRDEGGRAKTTTPIAEEDITTKKYVDDGLFEKSEREHLHAKDDVMGLDKVDKAVLSVNNVTPDSEGNVSLDYGGVKSIDNIFPDSEGNITLPSATETGKGVVRFATVDETTGGESNETAVTPAQLGLFMNSIMQYIMMYAESSPIYQQIEFEIAKEYEGDPGDPVIARGILIQKEAESTGKDEYMLYRKFVGYTVPDGNIRDGLLSPAKAPFSSTTYIYKFIQPGVKHRFLSISPISERVYPMEYANRTGPGDFDLKIHQPTMQPIPLEFEIASYAPKTS